MLWGERIGMTSPSWCATSAGALSFAAGYESDTQPHRWVHRQVREVIGMCPRDVGTFIVDGELAAAQGGGEAQRELLADFTIGEGDDVIGVSVDAPSGRSYPSCCGLTADCY